MVLEIPHTKSLSGSCVLPPDPDLLFLTLAIGYASGRRCTLSPVHETPLVREIMDLFRPRLEFEMAGSICTVHQSTDDQPLFRLPPYQELLYGDFIVFLLLGRGKTVSLERLHESRLDGWIQVAKRVHCTLAATHFGTSTELTLMQTEGFTIPEETIEQELLHPLIGMLCGLRKKGSFMVDYHLQTPLRPLLPLFDYTFQVKSLVEVKKEDPLTRRIRLMSAKGKKKEETALSLAVQFDFAPRSGSTPDPVAVTLPGDNALAAILVAAKSIIPKGTLSIHNIVTEQWSCATLNFVKKMGCAVAAEQNGTSSFGPLMTLSIPKFKPCGRKVNCNPMYLYHYQIPAMLVIAQYAAGQTVLRNCEDLRLNEPDTIGLVLSGLRQMSVRFGEMPDGIVVDGAKEYDGFDIAQPFLPFFSGAYYVAGLKCHGKTTIDGSLLLKRWPDFPAMIAGMSEVHEQPG